MFEYVAEIARDPPGGIPYDWEFSGLRIFGEYNPEDGEWWFACAEYMRAYTTTGTRRMIGAGTSKIKALDALVQRLSDPLKYRVDETKGGWDTNWTAGRVIE